MKDVSISKSFQKPRRRKLSKKQIERAAIDRREGMSWSKLSKKYRCAINTMRFSLAEYSDEFAPQPRENRLRLETQVSKAISDIDKIKQVLKNRFNEHI